MFGTRMLACLLVPVLGATTLQTVAAEEPVGSTPPARSIREWRTNSTPASGDTMGTTPPAQSIREWRTNSTQASGQPVGSTPPARSIREWMTNPVPAMCPCPTATPTAFSSATPAVNPAATPSVSAVVQKTPFTISIKSALRQGNLVVVLDGVPIFNEKFRKPLLFVSQTTTWDPLQVAVGAHRLTAKVYGAKKTFISADYDLNVSRTKATALRFVLQGDKLTVELAS